LGHPVIDTDGHALELTPVLLEYIDEVGGSAMVDRYRAAPVKREFLLRPGDPYWTKDSGSWVRPTRNTLDRATGTLPALYAERLDEFGIDFALIYPSDGLFAANFPDEDMRLACSRAYNRYIRDCYAQYSDRMTPAAVIPCHTPDEAVAELRYVRNELGLKAVVLRSYVTRPGSSDEPERIDFLALGSDYDYDPVWNTCVELGMAATFHTSAMYGGRVQIPNYCYNHVGLLAAGGEAICKALFMGGVTKRFPDLHFAFLEGGVGWAVNLFSDLISHWRRRSGDSISDYDPANLDRELFMRLLDEYGDEKTRAHLPELREIYCRDQPLVSNPDNFSAVPMHDVEEMVDLFIAPFWFGCEADDPMTAHAFQRDINPMGATFNAVLGTDNSHWDVADMKTVLAEAYELVDEGKLTAGDFRSFVFENPVRLHAGMNPDFFTGTRIETAVKELLA
jgi:predicted TIM-barrel fold metal-dependent hydrolase